MVDSSSDEDSSDDDQKPAVKKPVNTPQKPISACQKVVYSLVNCFVEHV